MPYQKLKILIIVLIAALSGCGRGCQCEKTIDSDSERRNIDGIRVKIQAEKVQTTTTRFKTVRNNDAPFGCNCISTKSYNYSFVYNVKLRGRSLLKEACFIPIEENVDMDFALEWFNMKFSDNKKHFAVGIGQNVYCIYHLLDEGVPFTSPEGDLKDGKNEENTFDYINWKKFDAPVKIAEKLILDMEYYSLLDNEQQHLIAQTLSEQEVPSRFDILLLNNWPYSDLSTNVLTERRVEKLVGKSEVWKQRALQKVFVSIDETAYLYANASMLLAIDDQNAYRKADAVLFAYWPEENAVSDYVNQRIEDKKKEVAPHVLQQLKDKANYIITHLPNDTHFYPELKPAFEMLLKLEDSSGFGKMLKQMFVLQIHENLYADISDIIIGHFVRFSKKQQQYIVEKLPTVFPVVSAIYRANYYKFLCNKASKQQLKILKDTYHTDLKNTNCN